MSKCGEVWAEMQNDLPEEDEEWLAWAEEQEAKDGTED